MCFAPSCPASVPSAPKRRFTAALRTGARKLRASSEMRLEEERSSERKKGRAWQREGLWLLACLVHAGLDLLGLGDEALGSTCHGDEFRAPLTTPETARNAVGLRR